MSKHKYTTAVCIIIVIAMLVVAVAFISGASWGVEAVNKEPEYAAKLFSTDKVHTIDLVVEASDWDDMIANAQAEEYIQGTVVIDGEAVKGVGIRPKGNSSLSMISSADSDRYSFKIEFDHFSNSISYHGLDKLALNNIAQDNTYMKDYISYQMMNAMGADAPLSSFIWVTVNGEDWGLYLAAEGIEESSAQRMYGNDFGEIYKPDSMDMGDMGRNFAGGGMPNGDAPQQDGQMPDFGNMPNGAAPPQGGQMPNIGGFGMGGATSLIYTNDDPDSYSAIFDNAVFDVSDADEKRLIASLKQLNEGENIEQVVNVDEVIRYFVVHNFTLNSDSYTGSMTHNYYLAENDGQLSMIAWDYNLAFGGMGGFGGAIGGMFGTANGEQSDSATDTATTLVNYPIDSPMLAGSVEDKPMIAWIFADDEYLAQYHEVFGELMAYFSSGEFAAMYDNAITLISQYVEKDPSAFCTYEDFQKGSSALREFCLLRSESINSQLNGSIATTSEGQAESNNAGFVDASNVDINSMGSNSMGFGRVRDGQFPVWGENTTSDTTKTDESETLTSSDGSGNFTPPNIEGGIPNEGNFPPPNGQNGFPADGNFPQMNAEGGIPNGANIVPQDIQKAGALSAEKMTTFTLSETDLILILVCALVLIGGILFVIKRRARY